MSTKTVTTTKGSTTPLKLNKREKESEKSATPLQLTLRWTKYLVFYSVIFMMLKGLRYVKFEHKAYLEENYPKTGTAIAHTLLAIVTGPSPVTLTLTLLSPLFYCFDEPQALLQNLLDYNVNNFPEFQAMILNPFVWICLVYWVNGLIGLGLDAIIQPGNLKTLKIQKDRKVEWTPALIRKVCINLLIGQIGVILPCLLVLCGLRVYRGGGIVVHDEAGKVWSKLPSGWDLAIVAWASVWTDEMLFYHSHRLMHQRPFYQLVHKQHHEFTSPVALIAAYCHPFEMFLCNICPLFAGQYFIEASVVEVTIWATAAILGTQNHHCGYQWPWTLDDQPLYHDFHHERFTSNYGVMGLLDKLHGTEHLFMQPAPQKRRSYLFRVRSTVIKTLTCGLVKPESVYEKEA